MSFFGLIPNFEQHPLHPGEGVPLFISAGILKEPAQLEPFQQIEDPLAVPLLALGGFTLPKWDGNPGETFTYDLARHAAGNCVGLKNPGKDGIIGLKKPIAELNKIGVKTIIQVTNLPHEKPLDVIPGLVEIAAESEPTAVEVNFACPNGKAPDGSFHPPLYREPDACGEVLEAVRKRVGSEVCVGAKDGPHTDSPYVYPDGETVQSFVYATEDFIDFVVGINTIATQPFPELTGGKGGMSGPIVAPIAKEHARLWAQYGPDIPYLSTGGVDRENADTEIADRLAMPNVMRVGGAQEFFRTRQPHLLAAEWAIAAA